MISFKKTVVHVLESEGLGQAQHGGSYVEGRWVGTTSRAATDDPEICNALLNSSK